ncbi:MAG: anaerobic carbon-monoxide dehydrogenase catalytic subunit [Deltaproteobacteria bacterium]|nr:anaerobic carbon-monoxide dehydrogenase catalytic subunit [Deltaproteobacteria bacterium]MBW1952874.1 anaerobic carbon-monoxide dehydrogenase catalytic subunit [Deltaproteobacteria bacterium]MBW1985872.1 anaerobic carbon-monoxide dehydrogenase catalytic subunit [Deltaproteobacteria bacterium]MBW2133632.1 anaerobic carbon-monoxide dehydrogenase catalytic subunit [Deltaproteobacteria bacterium]
MAEEVVKVESRTVDPAEQEMLKKAQAEGIETIWDRADKMKPCPIGAEGSCCRICSQGPCRVPMPKKKKGEEEPAEKKARMGLCGATAETIIARNFARMVCAGSAAHTDHARGVAHLFKEVAHGRAPGYELKDVAKLRQVARDYDVPLTVGEGDEKKPRPKEEIAQELADKVLAEFGQQSGELVFPSKRPPKKRIERWRELGVMPRGLDREIVEIMHRTHMGVDQDYKNIIHQCTRCAISDGWGGSMLATDLQDILFGCPVPVLGDSNLGVLKEDHVNIIIHGHEPLLPEMINVASQDPELLEYAKSKGAKGIQLAGICCSANEILMRHGIPVAANFLGQELAIITGAVDAMVVDVQCQFQSLGPLVKCFHTKLITTDERGRIEEETMYIPFDDHHAPEIARQVVREAIDNFPNRRAPVIIPDIKYPCVVGFSYETIRYLLGGSIRGTYYTLNDNVIGGRIRGVAGVVGCNNVRQMHDNAHLTMVKELIKNDVIVLTTGCNAIACAKEGLLTPEAAVKYCGVGLAEVCETVGIPPVLHMGSCVDNARILMAATACVKAGGLGTDISDLPVAGAAPEWMSEKAISIGHYFVSSGVYTIFGVTFPTTGSELMCDYLFKGLEEELGGMWDFDPDPIAAAQKMIAHIDKKRKALGIDKARERVLYDMAMRREMEEKAAAAGEE